MYGELISGMIKQYGRTCRIVPPDGLNQVDVNAIINPLLYKNKMYLNDAYLVDGYCDKGLYLYIGDPRVSLNNYSLGTVLRCGTNEYTIMKTEQYYVESTAVYTWAVLQRRKEIEPDA